MAVIGTTAKIYWYIYNPATSVMTYTLYVPNLVVHGAHTSTGTAGTAPGVLTAAANSLFSLSFTSKIQNCLKNLIKFSLSSDVIAQISISNVQLPLTKAAMNELTVTSVQAKSVTAGFLGMMDTATPPVDQQEIFNNALNVGLGKWIVANPSVLTKFVQYFLKSMK